jgi:5-deoxy-glucuronate isomerase
MNEWLRPAGSTGDAEFDVRIAPGTPGWSHTGLYAVTLAAHESRTIETGDCEWIVLPLSGGSAVVEVGELVFFLTGRADVFAGPTDLLYVPRDSRFTVTSTDGGRIAFPFAKADRAFPVCRVDSAQVPVELRGTGSSSRQVHNFGTPDVLEADSIIACEVITPAGNWSSYPPHKHDEDREGIEAALEEIYYIEVHPQGCAYLRNYGTETAPIDTLAEVRTGDVVLIPHGWHGPAMAPPGYDLYYLNVMAGPGESRAWLICDDPAHAWVRGGWAAQPVDPRLPYPRPR